jgi:hypothetical protein
VKKPITTFDGPTAYLPGAVTTNAVLTARMRKIPIIPATHLSEPANTN